MTARSLLLAAGALWVGTTLLLSEVRWFARAPLADRLRPYGPGGMARRTSSGVLSAESFREAIGPISRLIGERLARIVGITEDLDIRLRRVHAAVDVTGFRVRQVGIAVLGLLAGTVVALGLRLSVPVAFIFVLGGPILGFLLQEQRLASESARWQRTVFLELPVVSEQLALLLAAGWSLTSALNRIAARGTGATARDLQRVCLRIRQGVPEADALREWGQVVRVPAVDRLVPVLALNRDTSDLGRLIGEEARAIRRDVHRELIETAERRNQQVWIPVTVATLVPGVLFMASPFVEALRLFGG